MKPNFTPSLLAFATFAACSSAAYAGAAQCVALQSAHLDQTRISKAEWVQNGKAGQSAGAALTGISGTADTLQPHCLVEGEIEPRTGVNGKHYGTRFQLRLPENWNGKFLFQGGGGLDGFVGEALGNTPIRGSTATPALQRGYAVVSTDSGHQGRDTAGFAEDQQARLDYAYAAIGKVTRVAKQLIQQNYTKEPQHSYFMGCSNGGRAALLAAQRYPTEFDGIVAGNPGFRLSRAAVAQSWDSQHILKAAPKGAGGHKIFANALTQNDLDAVVKGVLQRCDAKDGLADGIVNAWESCDFKPEMVQKQIGADKVKLLKTIFGGAKNSKGENVYSPWFYDTGIASAAWRGWKLGDSQTDQPNARNITLGGQSLPMYFMTPSNPKFDPLTFDFDRDLAKTAQTAAINDATSTDFSTFNTRGGKMIIVTGISDPVFSAYDQRDWYRQLQNDMPDSQNFSRLFMVPGMTHCGAGTGLDNIDPLTALENWREHDRRPDFLLASGKAFPGKTQPVCAYPKVATYTGGDVNQASSFTCR